MQTANDIFQNPSTIKTKNAGQLVDDTGQKYNMGQNKTVEVSNPSKTPITKAVKKMKSSKFRLFLCL